MNNPIVSIVIPCYNSESTLESTLKSVLNQDFQEWEAVLVNDGSPDNLERIALEYVAKDARFVYFKKENGGLGSARNYGIQQAKGKYILPLDSDNLVSEDFATKAMTIFESKAEVGVVHGNAVLFGEKTGVWEMEPFCLEKMLIHNYIDACAIFKKEFWNEVGGYEEKMPFQGHEDWEFWVALGQIGVKFYHLNEVTFEYFVSKKSMIHSFTPEMVLANQDYIVKKYSHLYHRYYVQACSKIQSEKWNLAREKANWENEKLTMKIELLNFKKKLESEKFIINLVTKKVFGFTVFKLKE